MILQCFWGSMIYHLGFSRDSCKDATNENKGNWLKFIIVPFLKFQGKSKFG